MDWQEGVAGVGARQGRLERAGGDGAALNALAGTRCEPVAGLPLNHASSAPPSQDLIPSGTMRQLTLDSQGGSEEPRLEASSDEDMVGDGVGSSVMAAGSSLISTHCCGGG